DRAVVDAREDLLARVGCVQVQRAAVVDPRRPRLGRGARARDGQREDARRERGDRPGKRASKPAFETHEGHHLGFGRGTWRVRAAGPSPPALYPPSTRRPASPLRGTFVTVPGTTRTADLQGLRCRLHTSMTVPGTGPWPLRTCPGPGPGRGRIRQGGRRRGR